MMFIENFITHPNTAFLAVLLIADSVEAVEDILKSINYYIAQM